MVALAFYSGFALPVQASLNIHAGKSLGHPIYASWISFAGGFLMMGFVCCGAFSFHELSRGSDATNGPWLSFEDFPPWYLWSGGAFGMLYISTNIIVGRELGITATFLLGLLGQLSMSVPLDVYGFVGIEAKRVTPLRIIGVAVVAVGVGFNGLAQVRQSKERMQIMQYRGSDTGKTLEVTESAPNDQRYWKL
jgi:transporter family-2 protein